MEIKKEVTLSGNDFKIMDKLFHIFIAYGSSHEVKIDGETYYGIYGVKDWAEISTFLSKMLL